MAKTKAPKPKKEKPINLDKGKPAKKKKEKAPKSTGPTKPRPPKVKYKSDIYTMILLLSFFALVTACIFLYLNNSYHTAHM
jgi:hypothetical protein